MPSFLSGLVNAGTAAATGYAQGDAANLRALIAERARRAQAQRETEELELRRIAALGTAANQGLTLTPAPRAPSTPPISRRTATGAAPVSPEGGQEAASVTDPAAPPTAAAAIPAPEGPPPATEEGTPIGEIAGVRVAVPPAGLQSRGAREAEAKAQQGVQDRRARLEAHNATLPPGDKRRLAPSLIGLLAGNEQLYSKWAEQAAGLGAPDPQAVHRANRDYDVAHPVPTKEPNGQVVQTEDGVQLVNPRTGIVRPVTDASGQPVQKALPEATRLKVIERRRTVNVIDTALRELSLHRDAVGFTRGRMDALDQRRDPAGVAARAAIAEVGAALRHALSGAAVTPSEYQTLVPFIPSISDSYETAVTKLNRLRELAGRDLESTERAAEPANALGAPRVTPTTTRIAGAPPARTVTRPPTSQATRPDVKAIRDKYGLEP